MIRNCVDGANNPISSHKHSIFENISGEFHLDVFWKISPGEFSKTGAMQGGGVIFETPPLYLSLRSSHLCGVWICILLISVHFFVDIQEIVINNFINNSFMFFI